MSNYTEYHQHSTGASGEDYVKLPGCPLLLCCSIFFIYLPVVDQRGPSLSLDLCMHAGGWRIHTHARTFFHPRLNVALLAPGKLLAEAQMEIAEGSEHLPGTHSPVHLGLQCHAYFLRLSLIGKIGPGYVAAFDSKAHRLCREQLSK